LGRTLNKGLRNEKKDDAKKDHFGNRKRLKTGERVSTVYYPRKLKGKAPTGKIKVNSRVEKKRPGIAKKGVSAEVIRMTESRRADKKS